LNRLPVARSSGAKRPALFRPAGAHETKRLDDETIFDEARRHRETALGY
jgi:hypothetical protein